LCCGGTGFNLTRGTNWLMFYFNIHIYLFIYCLPFNLKPHLGMYVRSSGILRSVERWFVHDVLAQIISTILLMMGPIGCPETSVRDCHSALRKIKKKAYLIYNTVETCNPPWLKLEMGYDHVFVILSFRTAEQNPLEMFTAVVYLS